MSQERDPSASLWAGCGHLAKAGVRSLGYPVGG
jgi:hypothetical protein